MATKRTYNLAVKTGSYEKQGETKNKYLNIGVVLQKEDGGKFLLLDRTVNLAGVPNPDNKETVIVSMFKIEENTNDKPVPAPQNDSDENSFSDDDIPF